MIFLEIQGENIHLLKSLHTTITHTRIADKIIQPIGKQRLQSLDRGTDTFDFRDIEIEQNEVVVLRVFGLEFL